MKLNIQFTNESSIAITLPRCVSILPYGLPPQKNFGVQIHDRVMDDIRIWIKRGQSKRMVKLRCQDIYYQITIVDPMPEEEARKELADSVKHLMKRYHQ